MLFIFLTACFLILLDQLSKNFIVNHFTLGESKEILSNFFNITSHRNRGAAWGILQDSRLFFIVVTIIFMAILSYYLFKQKGKLTIVDKFTFSLIYAGAIGNFIDRLTRHEVVDFLDFRIFGYDFPIFNLADCFICVGVFFLMLKIYNEEDKNV
jgi:signal peptidase II